MAQREAAKEIGDAAAAWVVRIDRAPLTPEDSATFDAWMAEDIRHRGAYARARAYFLQADRAKALGPQFDPEAFRREMPADGGRTLSPAPTRRRLIVGGGAVAASIAAAVAVGTLYLSGSYATRRGEVRLIPLDDGSVVTMNTATKVAVRFTRERRGVRLIDGEALFDVAKNPARPFIVETGDVRVRAVGTSFTVRRLPDGGVQVMVREGIVELTSTRPAAAGGPARMLLTANQIGVVGSQAAGPSDVDPATVARGLSWREGLIALDEMSLQEATVEFARYSDPVIVLDDPSLAAERITGLFSANDPAGFARAAAESLNLKLRTADGRIHLTR